MGDNMGNLIFMQAIIAVFGGFIQDTGATVSHTTILGNNTGTIGYWFPHGYYNDLDLKWRLDQPTLLNFSMTIIKLWLEESITCKADNLTIRHGDYLYKRLGPFCGRTPNTDNMTYSFLGYGFSVQFQTDMSITLHGFELIYTSFRPETKKICDAMHNRMKISTVVLGSPDKYPAELNCSWEINSSGGKFIQVDVMVLDIEFSGTYCIHDHLEIWEIFGEETDRAPQRLGRFCGNRNPWTVIVYSGRVKIIFVSDYADNQFAMVMSYHIYEYLRQEIRRIELDPIKVTLSSVRKTIPPEWIFLGQPIRVTCHIRTHPGFYIQVDFNETLYDRNVVVFDGPDTTFRVMKDIYGKDRINSNGFQFVFRRDISNLTASIFLELTLRAVRSFTNKNTEVVYLAPGLGRGFWVEASLKHLWPTYYKVIAPSLQKVKLELRNSTPLAEKIGDCAYFGIAIFDGEARFDRMIGLFCGGLAQDIALLENFISSSSYLYLVLYAYRSTRRSRRIFRALRPVPSVCRGYQITKPMIQGEIFIEETIFSFTARYENNKTIAVMRYVERSSDECVIINFLPYETMDMSRLQIQSLSGDFRYRICRQFGLVNVIPTPGTFPLSKFMLKETCRDLHYINHSGIIFDEAIAGNATWKTEYVRLELGKVNENVCKNIHNYPNLGDSLYLNGGCGIIYGRYVPACNWVLTLPNGQSPLEFFWFIEVFTMFGQTSLPHGFLEIQELVVPPNRGNLRTRRFPHQLVIIQFFPVFRYRTLEASNITIQSSHLSELLLKFRMTTKESAVQREAGNSNECHEFRGHCYRFILFSSMTSWEDALNYCRSLGAYIVSINTLPELQFIKDSLATVWKQLLYDRNYGMIFIGLSDMEKPHQYKWVDGSPLTVSDWYYPFDGRNNVLPVEPDPGVDTEKIQPVYDNRLRCVAMNMGNPFFSTNWMKMNCQAKHFNSTNTICEYEPALPNVTLNGENTQNQLKDVPYQCTDAWNFLRNSCVTILTADIDLWSSIDAEEAIELCKSYGGDLAVIDNLSREELRNYIMSLGLSSGDGDIWVKLDSTRTGCISLSLLGDPPQYSQHIAENNTETCIPTDGRIPNVICQRKTELKLLKVPVHLFTCHDGTYLSPDSVCNDQLDCKGGEDENKCPTLRGTYACQNGQVISISKHCDFHRDCQDGSDENRCVHPDCSMYQFRCKNGQCIPKEQRCDHKSQCTDRSDEKSCDWGLNCQGFMCPAVGCLPPSRFQDLQPDCPDASQAHEDGVTHNRYVYYVEKNNNLTRQVNLNSLCPGHVDHQRCHSEHGKCFPRNKACIYDHDEYGDMLYCRNGAHLGHCESFECPGLFKCPESYCVPLNKACDGTIDCVDGADERNCFRQDCPGKYRCGNTSQCISLEDICNGQINCLSNWMDERFCDLETFTCPDNCSCQGYVISCQDIYQVPYMSISASIRVLDLDRNDLVLNSSTFEEFPYLVTLYLSRNKLDHIPIGLFANLSNLLYLDLMNNMISNLAQGTFDGLGNLMTLKLGGNPISSLEMGTFGGLSSLPRINFTGLMLHELTDYVFHGMKQITELDLSHNGISKIGLNAFDSLPRLSLLLLEGNPLDNTASELFASLKVDIMRTDSYRFCCLVGQDVKDCQPDMDVYSSCSDLIANEFVQVIVWMFGVLATVGNVSVICWRLLLKLNNSPSVFVLHLGISDTLMGIYLICLASMDMHYRGEYILHDKEWRESVFCQFLGTIATISCEMSIFTLFCIALARSKRLLYPFGKSQFTKKTAWFIAILGWLLTIAFAILPFLIPPYFGNYYGRNAICLPFNFTKPNKNGWEFATVVFVGLNSTALALIVVMYAKIYCGVKESQIKAGREDRSDLEVARRLSLVVFSNVVCFIPIIIASISAILGQPVNRDITSVLTTVILPVNSAINPYLFTFSTCRAKKVKR